MNALCDPNTTESGKTLGLTQVGCAWPATAVATLAVRSVRQEGKLLGSGVPLRSSPLDDCQLMDSDHHISSSWNDGLID